MKYGKELNAQSILKRNKNGHSNVGYQIVPLPVLSSPKKFVKFKEHVC